MQAVHMYAHTVCSYYIQTQMCILLCNYARVAACIIYFETVKLLMINAFKLAL